MPEVDDLAAFRAEIRAWITEHAPSGLADLADWNGLPAGDGGQRAEALAEAMTHPLYAAWRVSFEAAKLICPHWPTEFGGQGWGPRTMSVFVEECHRARVPRVHRGMGESVVGPSLMAHGTPDQQARFLPRIISGEDWYCQGFSEPDHGSDLAGIQTRGVVDGDELVITGQKIWTSEALKANMIFVLCRTDPDVPKHKGLSYALAPFAAGPTIDVRPVKQLSGASEFCEVFMDGLRTPLDYVIGGLGAGWRVALTTLGNERSGRATGQQLARAREFWELAAAATAAGLTTDPLVRQKLAWAYTETELLRFGRLRMLSDAPGAAAEIWKLQWSEYQQKLGELAMSLFGASSLIRPEGDGYPTTRWQDTFLASRAATIYAGTSQIQRNIIGERVLGLPR